VTPVDRPLRVTWLGHGAERTGPPIYLLRILEGLRDRSDIEPSVVLLEGGPLLAAFESLAPTTVVEGPPLTATRRAAASVLSRTGADRRAQQLVAGSRSPTDRQRPPPDVVVVNTAGSIRALDALAAAPTHLITHVHELATGLDYWLDPAWRRRVLDESQELWVVADAVGEHLVSQYGVDPARLRIHRGVLPSDALSPPDPAVRTGRRADLGVGPDDVLVGASGTLDWRKAPDLFLEAAVRATALARATLHFAWAGGDPASQWGRWLTQQAAAVGLADRIHLVPEQDRPDRWFGALDLFLLPSREDAYPLVCLEAAAAGVPIVTFRSGGAPELLVDGGGVAVDHPDVEALAAAVASLADDRADRIRQGAAARVAAQRHTIAQAIPPLVADLHRVATT